jgi:molybdopterin molybdotransferase
MKNIEDIAAELQGYDPQALSADAVNAFLAELVQPVGQTETLPLMAAHHRVLAADIVSPISVPPHDNSAMDGYAFDGAALQPGQPLLLQPVGGTAFAGKAWQGSVGPGQCVKIMTGAIMPAGLSCERCSTKTCPCRWSISCCRQTASKPVASTVCSSPSRSR